MGFDNSCILFLYSIAAEYFCAVCRTLVYPHDALQTPCTHLYCKRCLVHIACSTRACPFDGHLVTEADSKPLVETDKALADNIGKVLVRCNYFMSGCMWQGPLSECIVHRSQCAFGFFQVICIICGIQLMHQEAEAHAQICNFNAYYQMYYKQVVESHVQHLLMVHPSSGQIPSQVTQPPFPLRPLEPPQKFPPHIQPGLPVVEVQQPIDQQVPQAYPQMYNSQVVESHDQHLLMVHPSSGQIPAQVAQPPFLLRPLEPSQKFPPHIQPGLPVVKVQQPIDQQVPQVSAGYTSGHVQGQLRHTGGPPQLMQHPHIGQAQQPQPQHGGVLSHGMQPHSFQSYMGRPATLNQADHLPRSSVTVHCAPYAWPPEVGLSQPQVTQVNQFTKPQSMKNSDIDANGLGANLNKLKPEAEANNQRRPENVSLNRSGHFRPPRLYDPSSFTFFPQYQVGGSCAPSSPAMLARGPTNFANYGKSFESQYAGVQGQYSQSHSAPNRPPGFVSTSTPEPLHEQVRHVGEGFPHQHHSPGTELTRPRLSEPDLPTSYPHHKFPSGGPFCTGGSDSANNLRKRKTVCIGYCHLCQVDCESLEGLDMHRETHDYQQMYMDAVNNFRLKSARKAKTSTAHSGLGEASEPGSAGSLGCGSKP